jgi:hypothetical protein
MWAIAGRRLIVGYRRFGTTLLVWDFEMHRLLDVIDVSGEHITHVGYCAA